jgi:hypothetical protein
VKIEEHIIPHVSEVPFAHYTYDRDRMRCKLEDTSKVEKWRNEKLWYVAEKYYSSLEEKFTAKL